MISTQTFLALDNDVRRKINRVLENEVSKDISYQMLVWGSVAKGTDTSDSDLDVIIEYSGVSLEPSLEARIEDILEEQVILSNFSSFDPLLVQEGEVESIIQDSSVGRAYCIDAERWVYFE